MHIGESGRNTRTTKKPSSGARILLRFNVKTAGGAALGISHALGGISIPLKPVINCRTPGLCAGRLKTTSSVFISMAHKGYSVRYTALRCPGGFNFRLNNRMFSWSHVPSSRKGTLLEGSLWCGELVNGRGAHSGFPIGDWRLAKRTSMHTRSLWQKSTFICVVDPCLTLVISICQLPSRGFRF